MSRARTSGWFSVIGYTALALAAASRAVLPAGWLEVLLAGIATVSLGMDRRLGWLPAGLLVVIAIPYGRGADLAPWGVAGYPVRPPDLAIGVALTGALAAILRRRSQIRVKLAVPGTAAFVTASVVLLLVGVGAFVTGLLAEHATRDVLRDARWWGLYAAAPIAVISGTNRRALLRGLLLGATALAIVVVAITVGPAIEGGLKHSSLTYDRGALRMQFGNSIFLVPAVAYAAYAVLRRPAMWRVGWLALLLSAQVLTLTRMSLLATCAAVLLVAGLYAFGRSRLAANAVPLWRSVAAIAVALAIGFGGGMAAVYMGMTAPFVDGTGKTLLREDPFHRITFGEGGSSLSTILDSVTSGGRFTTYLNALNLIYKTPATGTGFGQLVDVRFAFADRAHTVGKQPGVDNAYLTVGLKAGVVGMAAFAALLLLPLVAAVRRSRRVPRGWYVPAWLGLLALTTTQIFAVSSYGPFGIALLAAVPFIDYRRPPPAQP